LEPMQGEGRLALVPPYSESTPGGEGDGGAQGCVVSSTVPVSYKRLGDTREAAHRVWTCLAKWGEMRARGERGARELTRARNEDRDAPLALSRA